MSEEFDILIPEKLVEAVVSGDCFLFAGSAISISSHQQSGLPSSYDLSKDLLKLLGREIIESRIIPNLRVVAEDFKNEKGIDELIIYLQTKLDAANIDPLRTHKAIAILPFNGIATTNYDQLIEIALSENKKSFHRVIEPGDIPRGTSKDVIVIKLHGCITNPKSIVITEEDYWNFDSQIDARVDIIKSYFMTNTVLFAGYGLGDENLLEIFKDVKKKLASHLREIYAVQLNPTERQIRLWKSRGVEIIDADVTLFLEALARRVSERLLVFDKDLSGDIVETDYWTELLTTCQSQVEEEIKSTIGNKYLPYLYVSRSIEKELLNFVKGRDFLKSRLHNDIDLFSKTFSKKTLKKFIHLIDELIESVNQIDEKEALANNIDQIESFFRNEDRLATNRVLEIRKYIEEEEYFSPANEVNSLLKNIYPDKNTERELMRLTKTLSNKNEFESNNKNEIENIFDFVSFKHIYLFIEKLKNLVEKSDNKCFIIIDRAGSGKTNLISDVALNLSKIQPTIFISGKRSIADEFSIERRIQSSMAYNPTWDYDSFHRLFEDIERYVRKYDSDLIIFIDAINENRDIEFINQALLHILNHYKSSRVRVCFTCRDIYWDFFSVDRFQDYAWEISKGALYNYSEVEFNQAWRSYFKNFKIRAVLQDEAKRRLRHPLLLRIFCETYGDMDRDIPLSMGVVAQLRLKPLFDDYWDNKIKAISKSAGFRTTDSVESFILSISRYLRENEQNQLDISSLEKITGITDLDASKSVYTLILDEDVILEERVEKPSDRHITFTYDEFMEYVMARDLFVELNRLDSVAFKNELEELVSRSEIFRPLIGAIEFLTQMFDIEKATIVWGYLSRRSSKWQLSVLQAVTQIQVIDFDETIFDIIDNLINFGNENVKLDLIRLFPKLIQYHEEKVIEKLDILSKDESPEVRIAVINSLLLCKSPVIKETIAKIIVDKNPIVRHRAVESVADFWPPESPEILFPSLADEDPHIQSAAIRSLTKFQRDKVVPMINSCLRDKNHIVRSSAILALVDLRANSAIPDIMDALDDKNSIVRENSAFALGKFNAKEAEPKLISLLRDKYRHVKEAAAWSLGELSMDNCESYLIKNFKESKDRYLRASIIEALGKLKTQTAKDFIITALSDSNENVRWQSTIALSQFDDEGSLTALKRALGDRNGDVRKQAILALTKQEHPMAETMLLEATTDNHPVTRATALQAITAKGYSGTEGLLINALQDKSYIVKIAAIEGLKEIKSENSLKALVDIYLNSSKDIKTQAEKALMSIGNAKRLENYFIEASDGIDFLPQDIQNDIDDIINRIEYQEMF